MTLEINTIASGSTGNCYRISDGETVLMIECGLPIRKIKQTFNFKLSGVAGCLISHEHLDHSKSFLDLVKTGIDCYASEGTINECLGGVRGHRINTIRSMEAFKIGNMVIMPFKVQHDASEPLGFLIDSHGDNRLLFATDTYYIKYQIPNLTHAMIECNYSIDILNKNIEKGIIPKVFQKRIIRSHFELGDVKEFFRSNDLSKLKEVHLIHISKTNGDPELFKKEIQQITGVPVYV